MGEAEHPNHLDDGELELSKEESLAGGLELRWALLSDIGIERNENQDYAAVADVGDDRLFVVCDGMGGHAGGRTASHLAVSTIVDVYSSSKGKDPPERIEKAILEANRRIIKKAKKDPTLRNMGTTCVVVAIEAEKRLAHVAHVGDSRVYFARSPRFTRLTRDHSMIQRMIDDGILSEEEAVNHPISNVISKSLGGSPRLEVEHQETPIALESGDFFVLCTDGLTGKVRDPELGELAWKQPPAAAAARLVDLANDRGGDDNITVIIVAVGEPSEPPDAMEIVTPEPYQPPLEERLARADDEELDETVELDGYEDDDDDLGLAETREVEPYPDDVNPYADTDEGEPLSRQPPELGPPPILDEALAADEEEAPSVLPDVLLGAVIGLIVFLAVFLLTTRWDGSPFVDRPPAEPGLGGESTAPP